MHTAHEIHSSYAQMNGAPQAFAIRLFRRVQCTQMPKSRAETTSRIKSEQSANLPVATLSPYNVSAGEQSIAICKRQNYISVRLCMKGLYVCHEVQGTHNLTEDRIQLSLNVPELWSMLLACQFVGLSLLFVYTYFV